MSFVSLAVFSMFIPSSQDSSKIRLEKSDGTKETSNQSHGRALSVGTGNHRGGLASLGDRRRSRGRGGGKDDGGRGRSDGSVDGVVGNGRNDDSRVLGLNDTSALGDGNGNIHSAGLGDSNINSTGLGGGNINSIGLGGGFGDHGSVGMRDHGGVGVHLSDGRGDGIGLGDVDSLSLGDGGDDGLGADDRLIDISVLILGGDCGGVDSLGVRDLGVKGGGGCPDNLNGRTADHLGLSDGAKLGESGVNDYSPCKHGVKRGG